MLLEVLLCWGLLQGTPRADGGGTGMDSEHMSKCMRTYLKGRQTEREDFFLEDDIGIGLNVHKMIDEMGGNCIPVDNLPKSYAAECQPNLFQNETSILVDFNNGRFGNQLSSLASTFGLARAAGLRPFLTHRCHSTLSHYFSAIHLPVLERTFCTPCSSLRFQRLVSAPRRRGRVYKTAAAYANLLPLYLPHLPLLREMLTFRERFSVAAQKELVRVGQAAGYVQPTFVGVHNRRADYGPHMQGYGIQLVGSSYFQAAIQLMRTVLVKPVFLVVTDDMPWARKHITGGDIFYSESATMQAAKDAVGTDLAILAACNHTIITYGTFGLWGALLAGGATVMSAKAKVLRELLADAGADTFVHLDEFEDWRLQEATVQQAIHNSQ